MVTDGSSFWLLNLIHSLELKTSKLSELVHKIFCFYFRCFSDILFYDVYRSITKSFVKRLVET